MMTTRATKLTLLAAALGGLVAAGCNHAGSSSSAYPRDAELRVDQIQVLGSHNSYHIEPEPALCSPCPP